MMQVSVPLITPDAALFAPFGTFVAPPTVAGQRAFYSEHLACHQDCGSPVLHVNLIEPSVLPLAVTRLERHPFAAQVFLPFAVSRYVVLVAPSDAAGEPIAAQALAMLAPGNIGVIYRPGVWHAGAAVLDAAGSFAVLMCRSGHKSDDEFRTIARIEINAAAAPVRPQQPSHAGLFEK